MCTWKNIRAERFYFDAYIVGKRINRAIGCSYTRNHIWMKPPIHIFNPKLLHSMMMMGEIFLWTDYGRVEILKHWSGCLLFRSLVKQVMFFKSMHKSCTFFLATMANKDLNSIFTPWNRPVFLLLLLQNIKFK